MTVNKFCFKDDEHDRNNIFDIEEKKEENLNVDENLEDNSQDEEEFKDIKEEHKETDDVKVTENTEENIEFPDTELEMTHLVGEQYVDIHYTGCFNSSSWFYFSFSQGVSIVPHGF